MGDPAAGCALLLVFTHAIRFKIRDEGFVRNNAVHIAIGILPDTDKKILGIWIEQHEGLGFWLRPMNKLKNRGTGHSLTAVVDGLKGRPDVLTAMLARLKRKHLRQSRGGSRRH
jgi:putative transposase